MCVCAFWLCNFHPSKIALQSDWEKVMYVEFNFFGWALYSYSLSEGNKTKPPHNHHTDRKSKKLYGGGGEDGMVVGHCVL